MCRKSPVFVGALAARRCIRSIRVFLFVFCVSLFSMAGAVSSALAMERVTRFDSRIEVERNGDVVVREEIRVMADGKSIKHGIYRDLLTGVARWQGLLRAKLEVLEVERDGRAEKWHMEVQPGVYRIYFGDESTYVSTGMHSYVVRYRLSDQVRAFADFDELYWNVTGNDWKFPIESASATLVLPDGAVVADTYVYSGATGQKGVDGRTAILQQDGSGNVQVQTLVPLAAGEGLTFAVSWQKGVVMPAPFGDVLLRQFTDDRTTGLIVLTLFGMLLYYLLVWSSSRVRVPRDSATPVFKPTLSAGEVRYLRRMGYDHKVFAALVTSLARKGYLVIRDEGDKETVLVRKDAYGEDASGDEKYLFDLLFARGRKMVALTRDERSHLQMVISKMREYYSGKFAGFAFNKNTGLRVLGGLLSFAGAFFAMLPMNSGNPETAFVGMFMLVWLSFWSVGVLFLLVLVYGAWREFFRGSFLSLIPALFLTLFASPFFIGWGVGAWVLSSSIGVIGFLAFLVLGLVNAGFIWVMPTPTVEGMPFYREIDGILQRLKMQDNVRRSMGSSANVVSRSGDAVGIGSFSPSAGGVDRETFDAFLPYALALDCENVWGERFAGLVKGVVADGRGGDGRFPSSPSRGYSPSLPPHGYSPSWYEGDRLSGASLGAALGAFGAALSSAVGSSSASSSSGSSGGGSSGGGSGGGGGGGW